jgi:hypothetical protein
MPAARRGHRIRRLLLLALASAGCLEAHPGEMEAGFPKKYAATEKNIEAHANRLDRRACAQ